MVQTKMCHVHLQSESPKASYVVAREAQIQLVVICFKELELFEDLTVTLRDAEVLQASEESGAMTSSL